MLFRSHVKYIQSLSHKKLRDEEGVFVAEGPRTVNELLNNPLIELKYLFAEKNWLEENNHLIKQIDPKIIEDISHSQLERISFLTTPNTVLAVFKKPVFSIVEFSENEVSLMLDTIQDPGNMGSILRCADWFGIRQVICSKECVDVFNPKVVQSTMGSIARVQVIYEDLQSFLLQHPAVSVYATVLNGTNLLKMSPIKEGIIVIGNEARGIHESILALCKYHITIPRKGKAESLNAAVATGIVLSQLLR